MNDLLTKPASELTAEELMQLAELKKQEQATAYENEKKAYLKLREETITDLIGRAKRTATELVAFKTIATEDLKAIYELLKTHTKRKKDDKGNFQILSEDGQYRIDFKYHDFGSFDERSTEAVKFILDFIRKKFENDPDARLVIESLLKLKNGQLDVRRVQELYQMENNFQDPDWKQGIQLLKESYQVRESKTYINFYEKDSQNQWKLIDLSFSSIQPNEID